jgi:type 1 glutamine amidotransferase
VTSVDQETRCERYDVVRPELEIPEGAPRLLLFEKMTGFRDTPSVEAAHSALVDIADRNGWAIVATDKGGAITPEVLKRFDAVIWNNVSGDVLTVTQRAAFQAYIEDGGGFVGLHGSAGDPVSFWDWYVDTLVGARFAGHPMSPQFQEARVVIEDASNGIARGLPTAWTLEDEWYSFKNNPRATGATVIATLDESTYSPVGMAGNDLRMGADHPIAWTRCVVDGRSFYSAIGHRPEVYSDSRHRSLLQQAILWSAGKGATLCKDGGQITR